MKKKLLILDELSSGKKVTNNRDSGLLFSRIYSVECGAVSVAFQLKDLKGVKVTHVEYLDQTSSSGSWSGVFFQKYRGKTYVIPFSQEHEYDGFKLYTGANAEFVVKGDIDRESDEWKDMLTFICDEWYGV